jgi:transcriptional regulator with XRE-family HTH domain
MPEREVTRFGEKLRTLRAQRGLTVRALAKALGVSHSTVVEIETSSRKPSIDFAYTVATYFEVSADDLLDDEREVGV